MDSFDLSKYLEMALRRKYWIIIPFLVTVLGGWTYVLITPKIYEAQTLILVQPQRVPTDFVRSIVSAGIEERLKTISQQVTSRTNLESIIKEYQLFDDRDMALEDKVELLRKRIVINVVRGDRGGNAFDIRFKAEDPRKVMQVTNALASNFISENLKIRESQALGTSVFLTDELESIRKRLAEREEQLKEYRQRFMGAMPDQLQTNLSILTRLQMQVEQLNSSLRDAENRKLTLQKQMAESEMMQRQLTGAGMTGPLIEVESSPGTDVGGGTQELSELKKRLASLQGRYTASHPDVVRLQKMIAKLEADASKEAEAKQPAPGSEAAVPSKDSSVPELPMMVGDLLKSQLDQLDLEIRNLKTEIAKVQSRIDQHQGRVDDTPKREQELLSLNRDYDNLKKLYESMLNRKLEADIAVSMEQKQKGEQFRVVDPAKLPVRPVEPDSRKIILLALVLGLGLGGGLAYLVEMLDTTYKTPGDVEKELGVQVIVSMAFRYTEEELKAQARRKVLLAVFIAAAFVFSALSITFAVKGLDATFGYVKRILSGA